MLPTTITPNIAPTKNPSPPLIIAPITAHINVAIQYAGQPLFLFSDDDVLDEGRYVEEELDEVEMFKLSHMSLSELRF